MKKMFWIQVYETAFIVIVAFTVILGLLFLVYCLKQEEIKNRIEKGCSEEHMTFTSEVFECPDGKPFVHLSVLGESARAMCCAKE